jgi:hypothetical protein
VTKTSSLPKLAYLTRVDAFIFTCYSIIFLSIVEDMAVHVTWRSGRRQLARQLDCTSRWAFPLAFLLVNLFLGSSSWGRAPLLSRYPERTEATSPRACRHVGETRSGVPGVGGASRALISSTEE